MRLFQGQPPLPPHACAITRRGDSVRWIDTQNNLGIVEPRIYVAEEGVRELLAFLEWPSPEEHAIALDGIADLAGRIEELEAELEAKDKLLAAYETVKDHEAVAA